MRRSRGSGHARGGFAPCAPTAFPRRAGHSRTRTRRRPWARRRRAACAEWPGRPRASSSRSSPGGLVDGVEDLRVARAPAEVPGERLADLVVARIRDAAQEIGGGDDEARRAEPTLDRSRLGECLLYGVQPVSLGEPLDGPDRVTVRLGREHEAGADELAVEEDGARATLALLARVLRAGQAEPVAQRHEEALALPDVR